MRRLAISHNEDNNTAFSWFVQLPFCAALYKHGPISPAGSHYMGINGRAKGYGSNILSAKAHSEKHSGGGGWWGMVSDERDDWTTDGFYLKVKREIMASHKLHNLIFFFFFLSMVWICVTLLKLLIESLTSNECSSLKCLDLTRSYVTNSNVSVQTKVTNIILTSCLCIASKKLVWYTKCCTSKQLHLFFTSTFSFHIF